jgi:lupus La protein
VIVAALKKSTSNLLEISEDNSKVRRDPGREFKLAMEKTTQERLEEQGRCVYVKGFPLETTIDQLEEFFDQYGQVVLITMRKFASGSRKFKGSVFVEFKEVSKAAEFVAAKDVKFNDSDLLIESK